VSNSSSGDARHAATDPHTRSQGQHFDGDLRRALLDAAAAAIAERGIDAVSLRDVARRAGVSHAAPAHHFGDKSGLHTALATAGFHLLADGLLAAVDGARSAGDPLVTFVDLGCAYVEFATRHPGHFELMFRPPLYDPTDPAFLEAADRAHGALVDGVTAAVAAGWGRGADPDDLAALAWAYVHGLGALRVQGALARYHPDHSMDMVRRLGELFTAGFAGSAPVER